MQSLSCEVEVCACLQCNTITCTCKSRAPETINTFAKTSASLSAHFLVHFLHGLHVKPWASFPKHAPFFFSSRPVPTAAHITVGVNSHTVVVKRFPLKTFMLTPLWKIRSLRRSPNFFAPAYHGNQAFHAEPTHQSIKRMQHVPLTLLHCLRNPQHEKIKHTQPNSENSPTVTQTGANLPRTQHKTNANSISASHAF